MRDGQYLRGYRAGLTIGPGSAVSYLCSGSVTWASNSAISVSGPELARSATCSRGGLVPAPHCPGTAGTTKTRVLCGVVGCGLVAASKCVRFVVLP